MISIQSGWAWAILQRRLSSSVCRCAKLCKALLCVCLSHKNPIKYLKFEVITWQNVEKLKGCGLIWERVDRLHSHELMEHLEHLSRNPVSKRSAMTRWVSFDVHSTSKWSKWYISLDHIGQIHSGCDLMAVGPEGTKSKWKTMFTVIYWNPILRFSECFCVCMQIELYCHRCNNLPLIFLAVGTCMLVLMWYLHHLLINFTANRQVSRSLSRWTTVCRKLVGSTW